MIKTGKIWFDGQIVDWNKAQVHVMANVIHYGSGVFEGIRCYDTGRGGVIFRLTDHVQRLFYSAKYLGLKIPFSPVQIEKAIIKTIKVNKLKECYIRPVAFCGLGQIGLDVSDSKINTAIIVWPWDTYLGGKSVSAVISSHHRLSPKAVPIDAKINGYYVNSIMATTEAKNKGADEAILLDSEGFIAEGAGENVFIVKGNKIFTPSKGYILPGITRNSIIKISKDMGIKVLEKKISVDELKKADEIFFTGTAVEVCPVVKVDGHKMGDGSPGSITLKLKESYGRIVRGKDEKYKKWLTHV